MSIRLQLRSRAFAITVAYAAFGTLWIAFSDSVLAALVSDPVRFQVWSSWKGAGFVAVTAVLLLVAMSRTYGAIEAGYASLRRTERELRANEAALDRDNAERRRAEALIAGQNRVLAFIAQGAPLADSLTELIRFLEDQAPDTLCSVLLLDDAGAHLTHGAAPSLPRAYVEAIDGAAIGPRAGSCGTAAFRREPVYVADIDQDLLWSDYKHLALPHGLRACWSTPIIDRQQRVVGTFAIYHREPGLPSARHLQLVEIATQLAAIAIGRARTERELRRSEERFNAFMDATPVIAWVTDEDGRHVWMNRAWNDAFGLDRNDYIGRTAADLVPPEAAERIRRSDAEVLRLDRAVQIPEDTGILRGERFHWNCVKFPFRDPAGRRFVGGIAIDITKRKKAEAALREAEERMRAVVEHLHEGLVVTDGNGRTVQMNSAARRLLGLDASTGVNGDETSIESLFALETLDGVPMAPADRPLERVRRGEAVREVEARVRRVGRPWDRVFSFSGARVLAADGRELAFVTFNDITERRRAERLLRDINETLEAKVVTRTAELRAALERAESADRLKSAFLATMSHELRTPLNSIIGFTGILAQGLAGPLNDEQRKQLTMVQGSARHLLELINDVLDLSKIEAGQLEVRAERFDLAASVAQVADGVRPLAQRKALTLDAHVDPQVGEMISDRRRVEQILLNLLHNAIKFTERGGVTIRVEPAEGVETVESAGGVRPGDPRLVRFRVADTGIGIREEDLGALFQPFRQLDAGLTRQHEGSGLGLSICRRLAELLGGSIDVRSQWRVGSEFTVLLPLHRS